MITGKTGLASADPGGARPWRWPEGVGGLVVPRGALLPVETPTLDPALLRGRVAPAAPTGPGSFDHGARGV